MAQYNFEKSERSRRKVVIRKGGFKFSLVALIISLLLACLLWLYIEGSGIAAEQDEGNTPGADVVTMCDREEAMA